MDEFCKETNLNKDLKFKIRTAMQYNALKGVFSLDERDEFFNQVPTELK